MIPRKSTSSSAGSPANQFRQRVNGKLRPIRVGSGQGFPVSSVYYDPTMSLWKTYPDSLQEGWDSYSLTFPRSGMMRNGTVSRQNPSVPRISDIGCFSWPTPSAMEGRTRDPERLLQRRRECKEKHHNGNGFGLTLGNALTLLGEVGPVNPMWVEWLMGFPLGWTELGDSAMPWCHK